MSIVPNITGKEATFELEQSSVIETLAHALSTDVRLSILRLVGERPQSVAELASHLDIPVSTCSLNVQVLENAKLIRCEKQPGQRGTMKLCSRRLDCVTFNLKLRSEAQKNLIETSIPIGCYSEVGDVEPTCGFADERSFVTHYDDPAMLLHPEHFSAGLLWMRSGYVEYIIPPFERPAELKSIEISFEACAEAPGYCNTWPSDIYVQLNGHELGTWRCEGDFGGRRGTRMPAWWSEFDTQYGQLKSWRVLPNCTKLDGEYLSSVCLRDLELGDARGVRLRIGVHADAQFAGGFNLFGRHFGDHEQDIIIRGMY